MMMIALVLTLVLLYGSGDYYYCCDGVVEIDFVETNPESLAPASSLLVSSRTGNTYFLTFADPGGRQVALYVSPNVKLLGHQCVITTVSHGIVYAYCGVGHRLPNPLYGDHVVHLPLTTEQCTEIGFVGSGTRSYDGTVYVPCLITKPGDSLVMAVFNDTSSVSSTVLRGSSDCIEVTSLASSQTVPNALVYGVCVSVLSEWSVVALLSNNSLATITTECMPQSMAYSASTMYINCGSYILSVQGLVRGNVVYNSPGIALSHLAASSYGSMVYFGDKSGIMSLDMTHTPPRWARVTTSCNSPFSIAVNDASGTVFASCHLAMMAIAADTFTPVFVKKRCALTTSLLSSADGAIFYVCSKESLLVVSRSPNDTVQVDLNEHCRFPRSVAPVNASHAFVACERGNKNVAILAVVRTAASTSSVSVAHVNVGCHFFNYVVFSRRYSFVYALCVTTKSQMFVNSVVVYSSDTSNRISSNVSLPCVLSSMGVNERSGIVYVSCSSKVFGFLGRHVAFETDLGDQELMRSFTYSHSQRKLFAIIVDERGYQSFVEVTNGSQIEVMATVNRYCTVFEFAMLAEDIIALCNGYVMAVQHNTRSSSENLNAFGKPLISPRQCDSPTSITWSSSRLYVTCTDKVMSIDPSCGRVNGWALERGICTKCLPGYYRSFNETLLSVTCKPCPSGRVSDAFGSAECESCHVGKYGVSNVVCFPCPSGRFVNSPGSTVCHECTFGRFANVSQMTTCHECPLGKYTTDTASVNCIACLPGFFTKNSTAPCSLCPSGRYSSDFGATTCSGPCESGYQCPRGSTSRRQRPCGSRAVFCPSGGVSYLVDVGYYSTNCTSNATCASQRLCEPGHYCTVGVRRPCAPGSYSRHEGAIVCDLCPAGKYQPEGAKSMCMPCGKMRGQPLTGQVSCEPCPPSYYSPPSIGQCEACLPPLAIQNGTVCATFSCGKGEFFKDSKCQLCPPGKYSSSEGATLSCNFAPPNTYAPVNGTIVPYSCSSRGIVCNGGFAYSETGYWAYLIGDPLLGRVSATRCLPGYCSGGARYDGRQCVGHRIQSPDNVLCGRCLNDYTAGQHNDCIHCDSTNVGMVVVVVCVTFLIVVAFHVVSHEDKRGASFSVTMYFVQICVLMIGVHDASVGWLNALNFSSSNSVPGACVVPLSARQSIVLDLVEPWLLFVMLFLLMCLHFALKRDSSSTVHHPLNDFLLLSTDYVSSNELEQDVWHNVCVAPFKPNAWWYSSFVLLRRALVSVCDIFLVLEPNTMYAAFVMLHVIFLLVHMHVRPYHMEHDNILETITLVLLIVLSLLLTLRPPPLSTLGLYGSFLLVTFPCIMMLLYVIGIKWRSGTQHRGDSARSVFARVWKVLGVFRPHAYYQTAVSMVLFSYTRLLTVTLRFLYCVDVGDRWSVLYFSPAISCRTQWYKHSRVGVLLLLLYLICLPFVVLRMSYNKHRHAMAVSVIAQQRTRHSSSVSMVHRRSPSMSFRA